MTVPRLVRPGATYAISRRTEGRRFLLRPDESVTQLFKWVLALTAAEFEVEVHVAVCMSTHFHLVVTVPNANVSEFMHRFDLRMAKALQVLRSFVDGVVWAPGKLSIVELRAIGSAGAARHISSTNARHAA
jgi:REP element-mobilizing transposase RayT